MVSSKCPQIVCCGNIAIENLTRAIRKLEEDYINYTNTRIKAELGVQYEKRCMSMSDIDTMYRQFCVESSDIVDRLNELRYLVEDVEQNVKPNISSLKKRIKHCKNHMERQRLQKELNALYKEQKRRR